MTEKMSVFIKCVFYMTRNKPKTQDQLFPAVWSQVAKRTGKPALHVRGFKSNSKNASTGIISLQFFILLGYVIYVMSHISYRYSKVQNQTMFSSNSVAISPCKLL